MFKTKEKLMDDEQPQFKVIKLIALFLNRAFVLQKNCMDDFALWIYLIVQNIQRTLSIQKAVGSQQSARISTNC